MSKNPLPPTFRVISIVLTISIVFAFFTFDFSVSADVSPKSFTDTTVIWYPRAASTAFTEPGGSVTVEVQSSEALDLNADNWSAALKNDQRSWDCIVESVIKDRVHNMSRSGYIFKIKVPDDIPPELFTLVLSHEKGTLESIRAISVVPDFDTSFYIMQVTDEHVDIRIGPILEDGTTSGNRQKGTIGVEAKHWVRDSFNVINPRFILYTGDNMQVYPVSKDTFIGMEDAEELLTAYLDAINTYTVPTLVLLGNHDIGYWDYQMFAQYKALYEKIFGPRVFSFKMGSFYTILYEYTVSDYWNWAVYDYENSFNDPDITYRLVSAHAYKAGWPDQDLPTEELPADLMLIGHLHNTTVLQTEPFPVLVTSTAQNYYHTGFFNFVKTGNTWTCPQIQERVPNRDYFPMFGGSYGSEKTVGITYNTDNDGTATSNSVVINNATNQNFYDGRVKFLMARGDYEVQGGTILAQYDYDTDKTAVLVKVDIAPSGETHVSISPKNYTIEELKELIDEAEALKPQDYIKASWDAFQKALNDAIIIKDKSSPTQEEINSVYRTLKNAMELLVPTKELGDVNQDKQISTLDALQIIKYISGRITLAQKQLYKADVNEDGNVKTIDALLILQLVSNK